MDHPISAIARAHTNIALIKYWGKRDKQLFLPMNSSLSLTLDAFYTDTKVTLLSNSSTEDVFYLNGVQQEGEALEKVSRFLDLFRLESQESWHAQVESFNFVPTAAGLASSASAYAALAGALNEVSGLHFDLTRLSTLARQGSGSSTRSLFGGFVEWDKGTCSQDSLARPIDDASWNIGMIVIAINTSQKKISSRDGMEHTVATSPFYPLWVESSQQDLKMMKEAISQKDFKRLGQLTEHNGMKMHATALAANPPLSYWEPESVRAQQAVRTLRELGYQTYMTMDAGPNVKVLCPANEIPSILQELKKHFREEQLIASLPGPGLQLLTESDWKASQQRFTQRRSSHES